MFLTKRMDSRCLLLVQSATLTIRTCFIQNLSHKVTCTGMTIFFYCVHRHDLRIPKPGSCLKRDREKATSRKHFYQSSHRFSLLFLTVSTGDDTHQSTDAKWPPRIASQKRCLPANFIAIKPPAPGHGISSTLRRSSSRIVPLCHPSRTALAEFLK